MFGKLMSAILAVLIILVVPQGPTASADPTSIVDEFADTSKVHASTAGWTVDSSNPAYFGGDANRLTRTSTTTQNVVYRLDGMRTYSVRVHYFSGANAALKFYSSPDASVWTEVSSANNGATAVSNGWFKTTYSPVNDLPTGTRYLKIEISGGSDHWELQLGRAVISTAPLSLTDNADNWSLTYSRSANMLIDTSSPTYFNGDASRFTRSSTASGYVAYAFPGMTDFKARICLYGAADAAKVKFYASPDGIAWTHIASANTTPVATMYGWKYTDYSPAAAVPSGTGYLKVEFTDTTEHWGTQLGSIAIRTYGETTVAPSRIVQTDLYSAALGKTMKFNVYLPKGYDPGVDYPVLYLFHGYQGNENGWLNGLQVKEKADALLDQGRIFPLIIVSPQMDNSFGINSSPTYSLVDPSDPVNSLYNGRYEDYLFQDLIPYIDSNYPTVTTRSGRFAGGLSMGGFIALHSAFSHPEMFAKVGGHSPAVVINDGSLTPAQYAWLYPNEATRLQRDPLALAQSKDLTGLEIYLDCGSADGYHFYRGTGQLADLLQQQGYDYEYHLNSGGHTLEYWGSHVEDYLLFYAGTGL